MKKLLDIFGNKLENDRTENSYLSMVQKFETIIIQLINLFKNYNKREIENRIIDKRKVKNIRVTKSTGTRTKSL